jgi:hypothetical protein
MNEADDIKQQLYDELGEPETKEELAAMLIMFELIDSFFVDTGGMSAVLGWRLSRRDVSGAIGDRWT